MTRIAPSPSRVAVRTEGGRRLVVISVRRNWFAAVFLCVWLAGWAAGEIFAIGQLLLGSTPGPASGFLAFWLAFWTVAGAMAARQLTWSVAGREELGLDGRSLSVRIRPLGRTREYDVASIQNLREDASLGGAIARTFRVTTPGRYGAIAFDYGAKTIHIGADLDGGDVQKVLDVLRERLPQAPARF